MFSNHISTPPRAGPPEKRSRASQSAPIQWVHRVQLSSSPAPVQRSFNPPLDWRGGPALSLTRSSSAPCRVRRSRVNQVANNIIILLAVGGAASVLPSPRYSRAKNTWRPSRLPRFSVRWWRRAAWQIIGRWIFIYADVYKRGKVWVVAWAGFYCRSRGAGESVSSRGRDRRSVFEPAAGLRCLLLLRRDFISFGIGVLWQGYGIRLVWDRMPIQLNCLKWNVFS